MSHKDLGLSWATGPQLLLCPQHTLTLHLLGTTISGPGDHQGTFPPETGPCQDPPPRERASGRQAKSRGTVHQPGLQSSTEPKGRGRGHHRRPLWVILVKLEQRGLSPPGASSPVSKHFQQTRMGCHPASSSAHHNPLPTSIPLNSFHDALHTTPTLQTCAGA